MEKAIDLAIKIFEKKIEQCKQNHNSSGRVHYLLALSIVKAVKKNDVEFLEEFLK